MDLGFLADGVLRLLHGLPLTLLLASASLAISTVLAVCLALMRLSGSPVLDRIARAYLFVFRGSPLLVQIFLIYYGASQFPEIRASAAWVYLRDPFWCALIALSLNGAAYAGEVVRGGLAAVPAGEVQAARACGMSGLRLFRRVVLPAAIRQALPAYGNEMVLAVKATSLASTITLMEVTGIAQRMVAESFRAIETLACAGILYLAITITLTRLVLLLEWRLSAHRRPPRTAPPRSCPAGRAHAGSTP